MTQQPVALSETAIARLTQLIARNGNPNVKFRVRVEGGGCSGFQYRFGFDESVADDDLIVERDGVTMLVDPVSLPLLEGAVVDYVTSLGASAFAIRNPNAQSSCGCGNSFAL